MPRLPGVKDVTRVSSDGLRLSALRAPATDPTGAALLDLSKSLGTFGQVLGALEKKQKAAQDKASLRALDSQLTLKRAELTSGPSEDQSDDTGPFEPDPVARGERLFDLVAETELKAFRGTPLEERAEKIVQANREPLRARLLFNSVQAMNEQMESGFRNAVQSFAQIASKDPSMLPVVLEKGEAALRELAAAKDWPVDRLDRELGIFRSDVNAQVLLRGIENDNAQGVLRLLDKDKELAAVIGEPTGSEIRRRAASRISRDAAAFEIEAGRVLEEIERNGVDDAVLVEQARALLPREKAEDIAAQARIKRAAHDFQEDVRFLRPEKMDEMLEASFPGELASLEDQETFVALQAVARRLLGERQTDPAAYAMKEHEVARRFQDGTVPETAIALRIRAQSDMGVPQDKVRRLTLPEAQAQTAILNTLPTAERASALAELKERYGTHYLGALAELAQEGLDRPAQALAAVVGNQALTQALVVAQTEGRAGLRDGVSDTNQTEVTEAVTRILDRIAEQEGINARGFKFAIEDLAFHFFNQTGDADTAADDAVSLFAKQLGTFRPEEIELDKTHAGGSLLHNTAAEGSDDRVTTRDIDEFFEQSDILSDEEFTIAAEKFGMNSDRALLARDILRAARHGMTEGQKEGLIERAERSDRLVFFRQMINTFDVGKKFDKERTKAGILVFDNIFDDGKEKTDIEEARDFLAEIVGRRSGTGAARRGTAKKSGELSIIERDARKFSLNVNRPSSLTLLENLDMTVQDYISKFRKSSVRRRIPGEFLEVTVREALSSKNTTVLKLLRDERFAK